MQSIWPHSSDTGSPVRACGGISTEMRLAFVKGDGNVASLRHGVGSREEIVKRFPYVGCILLFVNNT